MGGGVGGKGGFKGGPREDGGKGGGKGKGDGKGKGKNRDNFDQNAVAGGMPPFGANPYAGFPGANPYAGLHPSMMMPPSGYGGFAPPPYPGMPMMGGAGGFPTADGFPGSYAS